MASFCALSWSTCSSEGSATLRTSRSVANAWALTHKCYNHCYYYLLWLISPSDAECHAAQVVIHRGDWRLPTLPGHPWCWPRHAQPPHDRGRNTITVEFKEKVEFPLNLELLSKMILPVFPGCHPLHEHKSIHSFTQHPNLPGVQPVQNHGPATPTSGQRCWRSKFSSKTIANWYSDSSFSKDL